MRWSRMYCATLQTNRCHFSFQVGVHWQDRERYRGKQAEGQRFLNHAWSYVIIVGHLNVKYF